MEEFSRFNRRSRSLFISLLLMVITITVFWPVGEHGFIAYDDDQYVTENRQVQQGVTLQGVQWAFTTVRAGNWHPLTWLSHMLDVDLYGMSPAGHHLTNLLLHVGNVLLLLGVLRRLTGALWPSAFVAALFAVHPLHVESVAWIAERKDVLSALFWLLTLWAYLCYTEQPGVRRYLLVVLTFAAGLLAKPMLVTLPFVLLLLDYWPLGRFPSGQWSAPAKRWQIWRLMREKAPLAVLSFASCMVTYAAQQAGGAIKTFGVISLSARIENALVAYVSYIGLLLWPHNLAVFYPHPGPTLPLWQVAGAVVALGGVTLLVLLAGKRLPYLAVGWFWYLGTLVPVIGLVQVGGQAMADRYTYLPFTGLFIIIAWGVSDLTAGWRHQKRVLALVAVGVLTVLVAAAWVQIGYWRTSVTLFEHALEVTGGNYVAHNGLANELARQGRLKEAEDQYLQALQIKPDFAEAHNNFGLLLAQQGKLEIAVAHYSKALWLEPNLARAHYNLGIVLAQQDKFYEAGAHYTQAILSMPDFADAYNNLGIVLARQGKLDEAMSHFREALRLRPDLIPAHNNLGQVLAKQGKYDEANHHLLEALRLGAQARERARSLGAGPDPR
ncbi:MAG: tetratricopeptide repeat protein [Nitrospirae bacterium]|nr:tetratricopeptide repeat protein [Nitrospirota bacterium]